MRPRIGIGVFVMKGKEILLGRRISPTHGHGEWSLPGGHLEKWESFESCCRREVHEETGVDIGNIRKLGFTNDLFRAAGLHYVTLFFVADYCGGELVNREPHKSEGWKWFEIDKLPVPLFCGIKEIMVESRIFPLP